MAIGIRLPGAVFNNPVLTLPPPIVADASLFILPGVDGPTSILNWPRDGAAAATVLDTPAYEAASATLGTTDGFLAPGGAGNGAFSYAMIATGNIQSTASLGLMGRWLTGTSQDLLYHRANTDLTLAVDGSQRVTMTWPGSKTAFRFVAGTYDGATAKIFASDGASLDTASASFAGGVAASAAIRVGGTGFASSGSPTFKCAAALAWTTAISDANIEAVWEYLADLMAKRGITVA